MKKYTLPKAVSLTSLGLFGEEPREPQQSVPLLAFTCGSDFLLLMSDLYDDPKQQPNLLVVDPLQQRSPRQQKNMRNRVSPVLFGVFGRGAAHSSVQLLGAHSSCLRGSVLYAHVVVQS